MDVRVAVAQDAGPLGDIFFDAIRAADVYSPAQRAAWAPKRPTTNEWCARLDGLLTLVADQNGAPVGFVSAKMDDGYLDLAFSAPVAQGQGVMGALLDELEKRARHAGLERLHSHASLALRPVVLRRGWRVLRDNKVDMRGETLKNFMMEKRLG